jgi:alpha-galactosidase
MSKIGFSQDELAQWARPGHWNDPDMLEIGNGGMTEMEYKTHMSLWSILAAPLIAGNDLRNMTAAIHDILTNREVIAIDQDKEGKQGARRWKSGDQEVWVRPLAGGAQAVGLFNRSAEEARIAVKWADLGIQKIPTQIRDVWEHKNIKAKGSQIDATVPGHGVVLLRVSRQGTTITRADR